MRPERLDHVLAQSRAEDRAALATYLRAGYPKQAQSLCLLHRLAEVAEVIELGWPVEPMLDGPVIRRAAAQSPLDSASGASWRSSAPVHVTGERSGDDALSPAVQVRPQAGPT